MPHISTFSELKKTTSIFDEYQLLSNVNLNFEVPSHCSCGAEFITTPDLTEVTCVDPYCPYKMGLTLYNFISTLGFLDFGEETCIKLMTHFKPCSFVDVFFLPQRDISLVLGPHMSILFFKIKDKLKESNVYSFKDLFIAAGVPEYGAKSSIFSFLRDYNSLRDLMQTGKVAEALKLFGGLQSPKYTYYLTLWYPNLHYIYTDICPHYRPLANDTVYIAITGSLSLNGAPISRKEFLNACKNDKYEIIESNSVAKVSYVIADGPSNTSKYLMALEHPDTISILSADKFYNLIKEGEL